MNDPPAPPRPADLDRTGLDAPFWEGCREGIFLLHRCQACGRWYWPGSCCLDHGAARMEWQPASGRGVVHTYTIVHRVYHPAFADDVPYAVAVVQLEEGPYFHTRLIDCPHDELRVGAGVEVVFRERADGEILPCFRRRS